MTTTRKTKTKAKPAADDIYVKYLSQQLDGEEVVAEYRFHPVRKWRFDYAIPAYKVAIEIDGGVWIGGRHNAPQGYLNDLKKFNAAAALGWLVLKFTPDEKFTRAALRLIAQALETRLYEYGGKIEMQTEADETIDAFLQGFKGKLHETV